MNGLDYAIIVLVSIAAIHGLSRGALRMVTSAVSLIAGVYFALLYYRQAAGLIRLYLGGNPAADAVGGYLAVFAIVFAAVAFAGNSATKLLRVVHLGWADRLLGGALGAALASVVVGLGVMLLTAMLPPDAALLRESRLAPKLLVYNRALVRYIPDEVKQTYELRHAELVRYWMEGQALLGGPAASPGASPAPAQPR